MSFTDWETDSSFNAISGGSGDFGADLNATGASPFSSVTQASAASGVGGIFGAIGDFAEGSAYGTAAKYADQYHFKTCK